MKATVKNNMGKGYIKTISAAVNPSDPSGEQMRVEVDIFSNGDTPPYVFTNTSLKTGSYGAYETEIKLFGIGLDELVSTLVSIQGAVNVTQAELKAK
jgi:hypothetical protein